MIVLKAPAGLVTDSIPPLPALFVYPEIVECITCNRFGSVAVMTGDGDVDPDVMEELEMVSDAPV